MGEAGRGEGREQVDEAEDGEGGGALNKGPTRVVERRKGGGGERTREGNVAGKEMIAKSKNENGTGAKTKMGW